MEPIRLSPIILKKKKTGIAAYREKKGFLPGIVRVMTSPKTTIALGATLATLLTAGALAPAATGAALRAAPAVAARGVGKAAKFVMPKTLKGAVGLTLGAPIAYGILSKSKKARELVKKTIDPREGIKRGEYLAGIIEDPKELKTQLEEEGLWETIKKGAKKGGKYGAIAAGVIGAVALVKTKAPQKAVSFLKEKLEQRKISKELQAPKEAQQLDPGLQQMGFTAPQAVGLGGVPVSGVPVRGIGAPGEQIKQPAIHNIIQIQLA